MFDPTETNGLATSRLVNFRNSIVSITLLGTIIIIKNATNWILVGNWTHFRSYFALAKPPVYISTNTHKFELKTCLSIFLLAVCGSITKKLTIKVYQILFRVFEMHSSTIFFTAKMEMAMQSTQIDNQLLQALSQSFESF